MVESDSKTKKQLRDSILYLDSIDTALTLPERAELAQRHRACVREHPHCAGGQQGQGSHFGWAGPCDMPAKVF